MPKPNNLIELVFGGTSIDCMFSSSQKNVIVTHAHSDHSRISKSKEKNYFMTSETKALIEAKKNTKIENAIETPLKKNFFVDGKEFTFFSSGHILGSVQIQVNSGQTVFTSDFKLNDSILFEGAKILEAETLVIESTFGLPEFVFPERQKIYSEIEKWAKLELKKNRLLVLGGYSIGKAQELTKLSNVLLDEVPLVHESILKPNKVYEEKGVHLGKFEVLNHNLKEFNVLILPPHLLDSNLIKALEISCGRKVSPSFFSGWNASFGFKSFPLSDHADFNQLMQYVEESGAKNVLTHHGFSRELAFLLKKRLGVNAKPLHELNEATQSNLLDF
jgi:putative mRNA 3-end processing factor